MVKYLLSLSVSVWLQEADHKQPHEIVNQTLFAALFTSNQFSNHSFVFYIILSDFLTEPRHKSASVSTTLQRTFKWSLVCTGFLLLFCFRLLLFLTSCPAKLCTLTGLLWKRFLLKQLSFIFWEVSETLRWNQTFQRESVPVTASVVVCEIKQEINNPHSFEQKKRKSFRF